MSPFMTFGSSGLKLRRASIRIASARFLFPFTVSPVEIHLVFLFPRESVYDAFQKAKDKPGFKAKHEAELVIFEAARSTLLAMQGDEKLPSMKALQAEQQRLLEEQQRLYDEREKLKKEARMIDTLKANVDDFLKPVSEREQEQKRNNQIE